MRWGFAVHLIITDAWLGKSRTVHLSGPRLARRGAAAGAHADSIPPGITVRR